MVPVGEEGPQFGKKIFQYISMGEIFQDIFRNTLTQKVQIYIKVI
jgi:hypothetical protein